jgi:hypothetical protein
MATAVVIATAPVAQAWKVSAADISPPSNYFRLSQLGDNDVIRSIAHSS